MVRLAYTPSEESLPCRSRSWSWSWFVSAQAARSVWWSGAARTAACCAGGWVSVAVVRDGVRIVLAGELEAGL